jgi:hypothetical protein
MKNWLTDLKFPDARVKVDQGPIIVGANIGSRGHGGGDGDDGVIVRPIFAAPVVIGKPLYEV